MHSAIRNLHAHRSTIIVLAIVLVLSALAPIITSAARPQYSYSATGNKGDVVRPTTAGVLLLGGGTDIDTAFAWMMQKTGGGDFVVLCTSCTASYNKYLSKFGTVDSVETLVIKNREASSDPFVVDKIRKAEGLLFLGGDQAVYVNYWKGTPVEDAVHELVARNVPIAGTSAGLAILSDVIFAAVNGSVTSAQALANPYDPLVSLDSDFLNIPLLTNIITDSHTAARDRMGRLVAFLARMMQDGTSTDAKGIGVDEGTAVMVEADGSATLAGAGAAYFLRVPGAPEVCTSGTPLTYNNVSVVRMNLPSTFNLATWTGTNVTSYTVSAQNGVLTSTQAGGAIY